MSGSWIAGTVRARLLVSGRCAGAAAARDVARSGSLPEALGKLAHGPYRRFVQPAAGLEEAQRAVAAKTLADLRTLAGWLPGDALYLLRALAAWFELANLEDRLAWLDGGRARVPFELGSLATAWPRAASVQSPAELRRVLAASGWGDPREEAPAALGRALRLAWIARVDAAVPELAARAQEARRLFLARDGAEPELWRAEAAWWHACEADARRLLHAGVGDRRCVSGAALSLAVDAHRIAAALAAAARNGLAGVEEAFDAAA